MRISLFVIFALCVGGACAGSKGPDETLDRYASALKEGDTKEAYLLMSDSFRAKYSYDAYLEALKLNPESMTTLSEHLRAPRKKELFANFRYDANDLMQLRFEEGAWRIVGNPLVFYGQETPRAALRTFIRAYELKRWDVLLKLAPQKYRSLMDEKQVKEQFEGERSEELKNMIASLRQHISNPIEIHRHEASMNYGDQAIIRFILEDDQWVVLDPD